jgi:hypothetical protein
MVLLTGRKDPPDQVADLARRSAYLISPVTPADGVFGKDKRRSDARIADGTGVSKSAYAVRFITIR